MLNYMIIHDESVFAEYFNDSQQTISIIQLRYIFEEHYNMFCIDKGAHNIYRLLMEAHKRIGPKDCVSEINDGMRFQAWNKLRCCNLSFIRLHGTKKNILYFVLHYFRLYTGVCKNKFTSIFSYDKNF